MDLTRNNISDVQKLLHPELLPRNELLEILVSRCVQQQLIEGLEKCQLVDLFQRIVMPLPQRTYNNKRRGKMLNELRSQKERDLNHGENLINPIDQGMMQSKFSDAKGRPLEQEKLTNSSKNSLDHIIINDRRKMPKIDCESSNLKEASKNVSETDDAKNKSNAVVKLKRRDTNSSETSSTSVDEDETEDKKKRRRIVWP